MTHRNATLAAIMTSLMALSIGCDDRPAKQEPKAHIHSPAGAKVTVAADGTKFDPPVEKSQLPDGVFYCDMGTVHYASQAEGDGKCPYCGMKLKKFDAAAHAKQAAEHGEGAEHQH